MGLLVGTLLLRPYVFGFLAAFLLAAGRDLGWRRTLGWVVWVWPLAWLSEFSSTRTGVPFGLYHYTGDTVHHELYIADVPFMDSLSFTFLAYAAFCLARVALDRPGRPPSRPLVALTSGALMMLLDVVIDPLAVRGDRWFLGRIFVYPDGGFYFGVPLSNFLGWWALGTVAVGGYLWWAGAPPRAGAPPGAALYYVVLGFNLAVTAWIGEWLLLAVGVGMHAALAASIIMLRRSRAVVAPTWPARAKEGGIGRGG